MTGPLLPPDPALLLDFDGTLVDFAPTPDGIIIPPGLPGDLLHARARCADALAIVTGRGIGQIDFFLGDIPYAVAGEHGAAWRPAPGQPVIRLALPEVPADWRARAEAAVRAHPGATVEHKPHGLVLHFRQALAAEAPLRAVAESLLATGDGDFEVLPGSMIWEIRPAGVDKGAAVRRLMQQPPFAGRNPVYIGDDITDEAGIAAAIALGGAGWRVQDVFGSPAGVRAWLARLRGEEVAG